jgi:hypothetical protein
MDLKTTSLREGDLEPNAEHNPGYNSSDQLGPPQGTVFPPHRGDRYRIENHLSEGEPSLQGRVRYGVPENGVY